jgi:hypothetical protein
VKEGGPAGEELPRLEHSHTGEAGSGEVSLAQTTPETGPLDELVA